MNVIVYAIPVFVALVAAEFGVGQGLIAFCVLPRPKAAVRRP